jgi:hypothetical protein
LRDNPDAIWWYFGLDLDRILDPPSDLGVTRRAFADLLIPTTLQIIVVWVGWPCGRSDGRQSDAESDGNILRRALMADDVNTDSAWTPSSCVTNGDDGSVHDDGGGECLTSISARHLSSSPLRAWLEELMPARNKWQRQAVRSRWAQGRTTADGRAMPEAVRHQKQRIERCDPVSRKDG